MSYSPVSLGSATDEGTAASLSVSVSVPAGATLFLLACEATNSLGSAQDSGATALTAINSLGDSSPSELQIFAHTYAAAFSGTVTFTKAATANACCIAAFYVQGVATHDSAADQGAASASANPPVFNLTSFAPTKSGDFFLGVIGGQNNWNPGGMGFVPPAGWTTITTVDSYVTNASRWLAAAWTTDTGTGTETFNPAVSAGSGARTAINLISAYTIKKALAGLTMPMLGF